MTEAEGWPHRPGAAAILWSGGRDRLGPLSWADIRDFWSTSRGRVGVGQDLVTAGEPEVACPWHVLDRQTGPWTARTTYTGRTRGDRRASPRHVGAPGWTRLRGTDVGGQRCCEWEAGACTPDGPSVPAGKNLYTNEYVAIKLVSGAPPPPAGSGAGAGALGKRRPVRRSPSSPGPRSCTWSTATTSSSALQVRGHGRGGEGDRGHGRGGERKGRAQQ